MYINFFLKIFLQKLTFFTKVYLYIIFFPRDKNKKKIFSSYKNIIFKVLMMIQAFRTAHFPVH